MSDLKKMQSPADLAAETELKAQHILDELAALQRKQALLHAQYSTIQELDPKSVQLDPLSRALDETSRTIGALARQRTDLLDGMPIIVDAQGRLCVVADRLANDAKLVERVKGRLQAATAAIASAEKVLTTVAALVA